MAFTVTPVLGITLSTNDSTTPTVALGTAIIASDGHKYIYAKSTGTIAAATAVVLTEPAETFAAGAGAWTTVVASVSGDYCWLKQTAI